MAPSRNKKAKQTFTLFVVTFLVSLVVITYFIKSFSPNVDVEIGGSSEQYSDNDNTESDVKHSIDNRLKWIQMEDNTPVASDEATENEVVKEKVKKSETDSIENSDKLKTVELEVVPQKQTLAPPVPAVPVKKPEPPKMSKVYVGNYPTIEAAILAQNKLLTASTTVSPFVKEVNGSYVLQAGSYANSTTADAVAKELTSLGFQARVVKE